MSEEQSASDVDSYCMKVTGSTVSRNIVVEQLKYSG